MIFNSLAFAIFLPIVLALYYLLPSYRWQNRMLLIASLFFYGWWDWRFLGLLALTILIDFYAAQAVFRATTHKVKKRWMLVSIVSNVTVLVIFKYSNFFVQSFADLLSRLGFVVHAPTLALVLPIGISFYDSGLWRLRRLFRYCPWRQQAVRHRTQSEFFNAVFFSEYHGVLAALAYFAFELAPRLCLYSSRW